jgi:hypothetical protein
VADPVRTAFIRGAEDVDFQLGDLHWSLAFEPVTSDRQKN